MLIEELDNLSLTQLKLVAKNLDIKGYGLVKTKEKMREKIMKEVNTLGLVEIPDTYTEEPELPVSEPEVKPKAKKPRLIKDYPYKKIIVNSRDPEIRDYPFGVNEYSCMIKMDAEVSIPEPVVKHIEGLTEVRYYVDPDTGYQKHENVQKFFVTYK